jgi:hypothetical protein
MNMINQPILFFIVIILTSMIKVTGQDEIDTTDLPTIISFDISVGTSLDFRNQSLSLNHLINFGADTKWTRLTIYNNSYCLDHSFVHGPDGNEYEAKYLKYQYGISWLGKANFTFLKNRTSFLLGPDISIIHERIKYIKEEDNEWYLTDKKRSMEWSVCTGLSYDLGERFFFNVLGKFHIVDLYAYKEKMVGGLVDSFSSENGSSKSYFKKRPMTLSLLIGMKFNRK